MVIFSTLQKSESDNLNQEDPLFNLYFSSGKYYVHWGKDTPLSDNNSVVLNNSADSTTTSNFNPSQLSFYQEPNETIEFENSNEVLKNWHNLSISFDDESNIFRVYINVLAKRFKSFVTI